MKQLALLLGLCVPMCAAAAGFCERTALDPEVPAGIDGHYEVVGKEPGSGAPFLGHAQWRLGKDSYLISRTVGQDTRDGEAWFERCGADGVEVLRLHYPSDPAIEAVCQHVVDADNYHRFSCRSRQGTGAWSGLEAWYQGH